ncbi:MAG: hypothetical protein H6813_07425 [Phycisphaeraceae bacterium]|nr:hypothetical protein [Phycisphaeraceae bacterium]MCB9848325.1 hypothetical protein [Phycisphaeraceae bacterium]
MIGTRWILLLSAPALLAPGVIELRGGSEIEAPIEAITLGGVRVGGPAPRTISWDRVKVITGEHASEALEFEEIADAAWRARTRLARGDAAMAEPLFAWLFNLYHLGESPTAALVADGYLRCLLDRAEQAQAVAPWLDTVRLREDDGDAGVLQPALPPIFEDSPSTRALAESGLPTLLQPSGGAAHALSWWYTEAARLDSGLPGQLPTTRPGEARAGGAEGEDLAFIEALVLCRGGDDSQRQRMRERLRGVIDREAGTWREAWSRVALGRSLLLEDDLTSRQLGVIELLHAPARFASQQPALAAVALRDASRALRAMGDDAGAEDLLRQLPSIDPARPAPAPRPSSTHVSAETTNQQSPEPRSVPRP